jgi:DNA polymerase III subunit gamma/tau
LNRQMIGYLRMLLHVRAGGKPPEADDVALELAERFSLDRLSALVRMFTEIDAASNRSSYPQLPLELAVVRAIIGEPAVVADALPADIAEPASPANAPSPARQREPISTRTEAPARQPERKPAPRAERREQTERKPASPKPAAAASRPSGPVNDMLEHLAANWTHIRRDVKAENSRIAALLSSADPAAVTEDKIILAAPYEFHRNKINEDSTRQVIERVLQQYTHSNHQLICLAPEDVPASQPAPPPSGDGSRGASRETAPSAGAGADAEPPASEEDEPDPGTGASPTKAESSGAGNDRSVEANGEGAASEPDSTPPIGDETDAGETEPTDDIDRQRVEAAKRIFEARESP